MEAVSPVAPKFHPVSSFPTARGDELDELATVDDCPISISRMSDYLEWSHTHFCLDEKLQKFGSFFFDALFSLPDREFWVWKCTDSFGRIWHILVGKGRSPFYEENRFGIWFYGVRYDEPISSQDFLVSEFPEYENANLKAH